MSSLRGRLKRLSKRLDPDLWHDAWMPDWARALRRKPRIAIPDADGTIPDILTQEEADQFNAAGYRTLFIPAVDDRFQDEGAGPT